MSPVMVNPNVGGSPGPTPPPSRVPIYPNLRGSYAHPPAWQMAGCDFGVGYDPGTSSWNYPGVTAPPAGVSYNGAARQVWLSGAANVDFTNWWFANDGGWQIIMNGFTGNLTMTNCYAKVGSNKQPITNFIANSVANVTMTYCTLDGDGQEMGGFDGLINCQCEGTFIATLSDFANSSCDVFHMSNDTALVMDIQQNLVRNNGDFPTPGPHPDVCQIEGAGTFSLNYKRNVYRLDNTATLGSQGVFPEAQGGGIFSKMDVVENVFSCPNSTGGKMNYAVIGDSSRCSAAANITGNYIDPTGFITPTVPFSFTDLGGGPYSHPAVITGNVNMITGATIG